MNKVRVDRHEGFAVLTLNRPEPMNTLSRELRADFCVRFADTHARVGILPGRGLGQKPPRLIGLSRAKQVAFTGMPVFAQHALAWGLVNEVLPAERLLARAMELAAQMCACIPDVLLQYKAQIDEGYSMPYDEALRWEEQRSIASARKLMAQRVAARREAVIREGRSEMA